MILNVPVTDTIRRMVKALKATLLENIEDAATATHVIAGDADEYPIRRTPKFMICLCRTPNILQMDFLVKSFKCKRFAPTSQYLLLNDHRAEEQYSFSMKQTLREGNERRKEGGLLAGWRVLFCDDVAGNRAPKAEELNLMVDAAGGTVLTTSQLPLSDQDDDAGANVIVITSDPALPSQTSNEEVSKAASDGAGFFTTTWLFECFIHQKLSGVKRGKTKHAAMAPTIVEDILEEGSI